MKFLLRFCGLILLVAPLSSAFGQLATPNIARIVITNVGPPAVSDELIRANIRTKIGDPYIRATVDDDIRNLYSTGFFHNVRVADSVGTNGVVLTYIVQGKPRVTEIKFHGNTKYSDSKLRKTLTSKANEPLDERKIFNDSQEIQKMYQKSGYPGTQVEGVPSIDESAGRGTITFEIKESVKVKIVDVEFVGVTAFTQKKLAGEIKTRKHWWLSWLTGSGVFKDEQFDEDKEKLTEFFRDHGYIDFDIKEVQFQNPTPQTLIIRFILYEGSQYKVGSVTISGNKIFSSTNMVQGLRLVHAYKRGKGKLGRNGLPMDVGDTFTQKGLAADVEAIEDFYGSRGYIDVNASSRNLIVNKIPNTETGTMDIEFKIDEGQKITVEKVEIRGNTKTKDTVIRRELAVSPGETFDMVRVKVSKSRLEGLQYFEKVETRPEPTDVQNHRDLVVAVDEKNTGNLSLGAGFSSVDSLVGFVEVSQANFDLFHPPTFTGGGQKFRLRLQVGTQRQDYIASFVEPWFLGRKLILGVDLYYRDLNYQSLDSIYDETRAGAKVSLTRALIGDNLIGSISYTIENVGIHLNPGWHGPLYVGVSDPGSPFGFVTGPTGPLPGGPAQVVPQNVPTAILEEVGHSLLSRVGVSLAYDTRNSTQLPNKGQRTELFGEFVGGPIGGDKEFYKLELKSSWFFRGFYPGHVLEMVGHIGTTESLKSGEDVPFYERYYLGGLYSLRGFHYRGVSPREPGFSEPIGGDSYWFGSAEYSVPIIERLRFAMFYDAGAVAPKPYDFGNTDLFNDDWGVGIRLNLPIGPLRLDYAFPIHHDQFNGSSGRFQFGVGYTREF